ncbi:MAG: D-tyrosyl-tRNA(Tyr) deacylase [Clostridia bacterium]|nr:D-tyrosyl-tRNA(Tyr) deacylase [Clostridia bacterium]
MRAIVQRVKKSELYINNELYSKIEKGFLVLLGVTETDTEEDMKALADKILKLRVFEDENGKMNLSVFDIGGELQVVSQFTLYADCHHGNRPSFINAAKPDFANPMYEKFVDYCKNTGINVETGVFGADMKINLINDGPVTIALEAENGKVK